MHRIGRILLGVIIAMLTLTCARITVNVYFPAAELEDAAAKIEQEIRTDTPNGGAPDASSPGPSSDSTPKAPAGGKPQGSVLWPLWRHVRLHIGPAIAEAQGINVNIQTPTIRGLIASRKQRYASLRPLLDQCILGETASGLVELTSQPGVSLKDKARAKQLRDQENRDRQSLYKEIAAANNLPAGRIGDVAAIFANVNQRDARSGWCVQEANGKWKKK
ncbi:MAG: YdbL family protein [Candidatus Tectomicrobia bacterium]|nr:YdbL family protein [Candidatus Tectomicrobia bacterium]